MLFNAAKHSDLCDLVDLGTTVVDLGHFLRVSLVAKLRGGPTKKRGSAFRKELKIAQDTQKGKIFFFF